MFTQDQRDMLIAPLARDNVKTRSQSGRSLSYIEGWKCIEEANRIFGPDCWTRETIELRMVCERERPIGRQGDKGWSVSYIARCKITVVAGDPDAGTIVIREGIGAGHGIDRSLGLAHESAAKEAETDAMKRSLMTFGYPFGLALYDKDQEHVTDSNGGGEHEDWGDRRGDELVRAARTGARVAARNGNTKPRQISSGDERVGPEDMVTEVAARMDGDWDATRSTFKATYLDSARDLIRKATDAEALRAWWFSTDSQKARADFELNAMELKELSQFCKSKIDELVGPKR
jgi:hypothetical protein